MTTETTQETQQQQGPSITLRDLSVLVQAVDVAVERGAFKGPEMAPVGLAREAVVAFIKANMPAEQQQEPQVNEDGVTVEEEKLA